MYRTLKETEIPEIDCFEDLISDFRREVAEICALLGYHAANSGNFLPLFAWQTSA